MSKTNLELRLIDRELPQTWDYNEELKKAQKLARRWATGSKEFLQTLWTAREVLSQKWTKRKDRKNGPNDPFLNWNIPPDTTWTMFLEQVGIARRTATRWLADFDPETGERKPKTPAVVDDKKNGNPDDIQGQYAVVEDLGPRPRTNTYGSEKFRAMATLKRRDLDAIMKPVIAQVEHAYRKIQAHTGDGSAMASVVNLTAEMMKVRDLLSSWTMSGAHLCPNCEGSQKITRDQDGKPVTIKCPHCIEGYVGSLDIEGQ